ncbi:MAG TPA: M3 family metallopeptidase [Kofleriaceae bacterium]|nr:M3 family metallopeptidase [Kofleriaceae bacterium]
MSDITHDQEPATATEPEKAPPQVAPEPSAADQFAKVCADRMAKAKGILPTLVADATPRTVDGTLVPYNQMMIALSNAASESSLMSVVHPDEAVRDAARACEKEVEAFITELSLNRDLYDAFAAIDTKGLDHDTARLVAHTLRDFRRAGVDKDEATREHLKEIDDKLVTLGQTFDKNLSEDVNSILVSPEDLAGLPEDYIAKHEVNAEGKVEITTDYPDYIPFMTYAKSNELRKALYIAGRTRGGQANSDTLAKILALRDERAKILGFDDWADYATADKMMKSGAKAAAFIHRVIGVAKKRARRDYRELLSRKRKEVHGAKRVEDFEKSYYEAKIKKEKYDFDLQSVRPYFPYEEVKAGLLAITSKLYGIRYEPVSDEEAHVWHPDVDAYDVFRGEEKIGRIYLDMHPREGKYKHAAQFTLRNGVTGVQLPSGALVCNFPKPEDGEPGLMEHANVVTMFHEFGHLMNHVLGGHQRWVAQSGVATEWDFVEAPSQMFEEWAWNYESLKTFAKNYKTGEVIPEAMVKKMRRADKFGIGIQTLQQMFYASISLRFHTLDPKKLDMNAEIERLKEKITPFRYVEGTLFQSNFGHLNGYSALYYTYMWSLVIAKDLLTPFQKHGLMNEEWAHKFRDTILVPGGTKDAADLVEDFLGRKFTFKAFEDYLEG